MIIDLDVNTPHLWKFVDDSTAFEFVPKGNTSNAQGVVNQVIEWSHIYRVQLKPWWMQGASNLVCPESSWTGCGCYRQKRSTSCKYRLVFFFFFEFCKRRSRWQPFMFVLAALFRFWTCFISYNFIWYGNLKAFATQYWPSSTQRLLLSRISKN